MNECVYFFRIYVHSFIPLFFCSILYFFQGYTSLGKRSNTTRNPHLRYCTVHCPHCCARASFASSKSSSSLSHPDVPRCICQQCFSSESSSSSLASSCNFSFLPAWLLTHGKTERAGRFTKILAADAKSTVEIIS